MASSAISLHGPIGVQDNRNVLINGDFNLWQRGVTVAWATNTIAGKFSDSEDPINKGLCLWPCLGRAGHFGIQGISFCPPPFLG